MLTLSPRAGFWAATAALLAIKAVLAVHLPLFGDEAFYWLESRHPAPGYDDVPLLTPALIALGTGLGGATPWAVRLPFLLLGVFAAWLVAVLARNLDSSGNNAGDGYRAGLAALAIPLFAANGLLALPDVPLTLAILLCLLALLRMSGRPSRAAALLLAFALMLGWLSHYRFALALAAGAVWLFATSTGRALLRQPYFWIAALAGNAAGLAPLVWHNAGNGWHGLAFQFAERHAWSFHADALLDPLRQAALVTPLLFLAFLATLRQAWHRRRESAAGLVFWSATALLAVCFLLAPFIDAERTRQHWPLPAYLALAAFLPAAAMASRSSLLKRGFLRIALALSACGAATVFVYLGLTAWRPDLLAPYKAYPDNFRGWNDIAARVERELADLPPDTVLAADNFMLAAQLAFANGGARPVFSLDHPLNAKHGRQRQLAAWGLDERGFRAAQQGRAALLIIEVNATRLRARPDWLRGICEKFPQARWRFEQNVDHGRKRFAGYVLDAGDAPGQCAPPSIAYLDSPSAGNATHKSVQINGWAFRDRSGLQAVYLALDGQRLTQLDYGHAVPGVRELWPESDDPQHPYVGLRGAVELPAALVSGRHWLELETLSRDGTVERPLAVPIEILARDGD